MNSTSSTYDTTSHLSEAADKVGDAADTAIDRTRRVANDMLDSASDTVDNVRDQAEPAVRRLAAQAETHARRSMDAVRDSSQQLREQATEMTDRTTRYVKDEPLKAVLIAAAAGAALLAVLSVVVRSGDR